MSQFMQIDEYVTVGGQPDEQQLEQLATSGFRTVVNMRLAGEEEQPMSPEMEGEKVDQLGMQYVHFPVSQESMDADLVDQFRKKLHQWPTPVFVHCKAGKRSGALVVMDRAVEQGWSGDETLAKAESMGFECDQPELKELVKSYVDSR